MHYSVTELGNYNSAPNETILPADLVIPSWNHFPDAMILLGDDGRIINVNVMAEQLFNYDACELLGKNIEILLPLRFRSLGIQSWGNCVDKTTNQKREVWAQRKDGTEFPIDISLSLVRTNQETQT